MKIVRGIIRDLAEFFHINLGRAAPYIFGKMIGSKPVKVDDRREYEGDYEKQFYDVQTADGQIYEHCRPNAGKFTHMKTGEEVKDVMFFRVGKQRPFDE